MKRKAMASVLATAMLIASGVVQNQRPAEAQMGKQFFCDLEGEHPVTRVSTPDGNFPVIEWKTTKFENYSPEKRCREVSNRFEKYRTEGLLNYMTNGRINNLPVICVRETAGTGCVDNSGLLFTLLPSDDPSKIMEDLMRVRNFGGNAVEHTCPEVVYRTDGGTYIDIEELVIRKRLMEAGYCQPLNAE